MLAFIVVALATVVIFQALTLLRPTYVQTSLYRELLYGSLVILLPTFIIGYLGWVLFHWHFPAYGVRDYIFVVLYDKFAFSTVLGVALGITIGVLLNSITLAPLHRPLTTKHKLLIGLAATLLFLGIGGERLSYDVARSVSKLSFGGVAEVSFFRSCPATTIAT